MRHALIRSAAIFAIVLASCTGASPRTARSPARPWHPHAGLALDRLLNVHRASAPGVSPDGSRVVFLSDRTGVAQAWTVAGNDVHAESTWTHLAPADDRTGFVAFAPDGRTVLFGRDHGGDENVQLWRVDPDGANATALTSAPTVKHMYGCTSDDGRVIAYSSNERNGRDFDVYVRPLDGAPRRLFEASGHYEVNDFSHDGRKVLVTHERSAFDTDVEVVDVATGTHDVIVPHTGDVRFIAPAFSHDDRTVLLLTDQGRDTVTLARVDPATHAVTVLLEQPREIDVLTVARDGRHVAIGVNDDGFVTAHTYEAGDGAALREGAPVALPRGVVTTMDFTPDGRTMVVGLSASNAPDEAYRVDVASGAATRLTASDTAGLDASAFVSPTVEHVRSFDGLVVPVLLYTPRDLAPGERAPAVVMVHGGPEGQAQPRFNALVQFFVGHGYVVVEPNVRGSTGYGKRYAHLDDVRHREDSVHDLAEVNRWLRARSDVEPSRIAVMGGSYGGYMTLAAITLYPDLWAAACDVVGIVNFRTFLEHTASYRRALREAEYGSLANDAEFLDGISPIRRMDRVTAPLFVIHGANDPRVPIGEAEQVVAALRARNHRVEYMRFDNEGHGLVRRENKLRAYPALVEFFDGAMGR